MVGSRAALGRRGSWVPPPCPQACKLRLLHLCACCKHARVRSQAGHAMATWIHPLHGWSPSCRRAAFPGRDRAARSSPTSLVSHCSQQVVLKPPGWWQALQGVSRVTTQPSCTGWSGRASPPPPLAAAAPQRAAHAGWCEPPRCSGSSSGFLKASRAPRWVAALHPLLNRAIEPQPLWASARPRRGPMRSSGP